MKVKQTLDFATMTWDQASRITCYERDRLLGLDTTGADGLPRRLTSRRRASSCARVFSRAMSSANLACAIRPGDHVTLDSTTNFQYAGEYEVLEPLTVFPPTAQAAGQGGEIARKPSENSGEIELALGPYNEAVMYDTSDPTQAGWPSVPGSDPGNDSNYTSIGLANGGQFVFFSGQLPSGQAFQLPASGFPPATFGLGIGRRRQRAGNDHSASAIVLCAASATRLLTLNYCDWEYVPVRAWNGAATSTTPRWDGSAGRETTSNGITWLELTLPGGETILFGQGILANGATIVLRLVTPARSALRWPTCTMARPTATTWPI